MAQASSRRGLSGLGLRAEQAPLRLRIVAMIAVLLAGALTATGLAATALLRSYLYQRQDAELLAARTPLVNAALDSHGSTKRTVPAYVPGGTYVVHLEWSNNEHVDVFSSKQHVPNWPDLSPTSRALSETTPFTVESDSGGGEWRVITGTSQSPTQGTVTYAVAASLNDVDDTVDRVRNLSAIVGVVVTLIGALIAWFGIRRAFRPLAQIEETAAAIAAGDLTSRVPPPAGNDEVASLARSLNVMLGRIEDAFIVRTKSEERMRQFVQDASHELRTPLATVRGYAELYRQGAVSEPDDVAAAVRRIEDEATRMSKMVDSLLLLNRVDEEHSGGLDQDPYDSVDVTVLAADAVQDARARAPERTIELVGLDGPLGPTTVRGDDHRLRQVFANLVGNALRYSDPSPIEVAVGTRDAHAIFEVRDHGPGIPEGARAQIFERFYRFDASRNSATGGSGLGLAIVNAIVEAHSGSVDLRESSGGGATFIVQLPLADSDAQQTHRSGPAQA